MGRRRLEKKRCPKCGETDKIKFSKNTYRPDGMQIWCKKCQKDNRKPSSDLKYRLKQYGSTLEDYELRFKQQNGLCAVCLGPPKRRRLDVDHDHATGKIRGLVHNQCNVLLGMATDNPDLLEKAARYLRNNLTS